MQYPVGTWWKWQGSEYQLQEIVGSGSQATYIFRGYRAEWEVEGSDLWFWEPLVGLESRWQDASGEEWVVGWIRWEGDTLLVGMVGEEVESIEYYDEVVNWVRSSYLRPHRRAAVCERCGGISPYRDWEPGFRCWGCRHGW